MCIRDRYDGGGALEPTDYQPPQMWIEAANYEICIEEQVRPIRNRAGLLQSILSRYRSNGGPGNAIFVAISSKKAADSAREASDEAAREQARLEREQTHAESLRLSAAKAEATIMTREERRNLFGIVELTVPIKPSNNTRDAFIEYGEILRGPLCRPLVQKLLIQADEA